MNFRRNVFTVFLLSFAVIVFSCEEDSNEFDYVEDDLDVRAATVTYQAEDRSFQSGSKQMSNNSGYTGTGFMDYGGNGSLVEWNNVNVTKAGQYTLRFRYANGSWGKRPCSVTVNGTNVAPFVEFASTKSWSTWGTTSIKTRLNPGKNKIRVTATTAAGGPNLDKMDVIGADNSVSSCTDKPDAQCANRAHWGQCTKYPEYMQQNCCATCRDALCTDNPHAQCANRAHWGQCSKYPEYMQQNCCATCRDGAGSTANIIEFDPRSWQHADTTGFTRRYFENYAPTRRIYNLQYGYHVFATPLVSDKTIAAVDRLFMGMLRAMKNDYLRDQFKGHHLFVITMNDPDVLGGVPGQKATGYIGFAVFPEEIICSTFNGKYRTWNTPVHELGHSIELTLGLKERTEELTRANSNGTPSQLALQENYAWFTQYWFDQSGNDVTRDTMQGWQKGYLAETFDVKNTYRPKCDF